MSTDSTSFGPRKIFGATLGPLIYPLLIIALSGDYYWVEGWLFGVLFVLMIWSIMLYLYIHDPALLKERMNKSSSDQDPKDKWIFKLISAFYIPWLVIIPLDAKRYKWSQHVIGSIPFFWVIKWFNLLFTNTEREETNSNIGWDVWCYSTSNVLWRNINAFFNATVSGIVVWFSVRGDIIFCV
eukprot:260260_1